MERRVHFRFRSGGMKVKVRIAVADRATFMQEYLNNISRGGCFIESTARVSDEQQIRVLFEIADRVNVELDGEVTHVSEHEPQGFGVRFLNVTPERLADLDSFIAGVVGELGQRGARQPTRKIPPQAVAALRRKLEELEAADEERKAAASSAEEEAPLQLDDDDLTLLEVDVDLEQDAGMDFDDTTLMGATSPPARPEPDSALAAEIYGLSGPQQTTAAAGPNDSVAPEMLELLASLELRLGGDSAYHALGSTPADDSDTIAVKVAGDLEKLDELRVPLGNHELLARLSQVRSAIELAWSYISDSRARAALDISLGHLSFENRTAEEREALIAAADALRIPYVREHAGDIKRAEICEETARREADDGELDRALVSAQQAVELDPYNLSLRQLVTELELRSSGKTQTSD